MIVSSIVIAALVLLFGRALLSLLISGEPERITAALDIAQQKLIVTALGLPVLYLLFLYRSTLQGIGNSLMPLLAGFLELIGRISSVLFLVLFIGVWGVYASDTLGWILSMLFMMIAYYVLYKKRYSTRINKCDTDET